MHISCHYNAAQIHVLLLICVISQKELLILLGAMVETFGRKEINFVFFLSTPMHHAIISLIDESDWILPKTNVFIMHIFLTHHLCVCYQD